MFGPTNGSIMLFRHKYCWISIFCWGINCFSTYMIEENASDYTFQFPNCNLGYELVLVGAWLIRLRSTLLLPINQRSDITAITRMWNKYCHYEHFYLPVLLFFVPESDSVSGAVRPGTVAAAAEISGVNEPVCMTTDHFNNQIWWVYANFRNPGWVKQPHASGSSATTTLRALLLPSGEFTFFTTFISIFSAKWELS